jgi:hypothetical protein
MGRYNGLTIPGDDGAMKEIAEEIRRLREGEVEAM